MAPFVLPPISPDDVNDASIDDDIVLPPPLERRLATLIPPLAAYDENEMGRNKASNSSIDRLLSDDGRAHAKNS